MALVYINYGDIPAKTETFCCGEDELDTFIREQAGEFVAKGLSAVTLLIDEDTREVYGFYAISPYSRDGRTLREEQRKYFNVDFAIPAWKIGELAIDKKYQRSRNNKENRRYGSILLQEAIRDIQSRAAKGAGALIFVDAINKRVKKFYKKFGFTSIPNTSNQMARPLAEPRKVS